MARRRKKKTGKLPAKVGILLVCASLAYSAASIWFVHHPREWLDEKCEALPRFATAALFFAGNPLGDLTDALGWTGHDAVYEYDTEAPSGEVLFAGAPRRVSPPAPDDITIIRRGEFTIGWSPSLRHPVWVAYHVVPEAKYEAGERPKFQRDKEAANAPKPGDYSKTSYDRGHMAPNHAIATRYGADAQAKTFLMGNIAPQTPALNRGPWREVEHRIADLWTRRWGEIWVIVGCYSSGGNCEILSGSDSIDVPERFYQVIVAQDGMDVRALAVDFPQGVAWREWPSRCIVSIDELERRTGLDFLPDLDEFIASPLEAELPTRLWPIRLGDVFKMLKVHFR